MNKNDNMRRRPISVRISLSLMAMRYASKIVSLSLIVAWTSAAYAVPYYWDIDGVTTAGAGGGTSPSSTWSTGGTTWSTDSTGSSATGTVTTAGGDTGTFSAGATATGSYTVTVSGTQTIGTLTFEDGLPSLTGGTLNMNNGSGTGTFNVNVNTDIASVIGGANLVKNGTGTLTWSGTGTNTYVANLIVNAGTLNLYGIHTPDTSSRLFQLVGTSAINLYGTENLNNGGQVIIGQTTAGTSTLTVKGGGVLTQTGAVGNAIVIVGNVANGTGILTIESGGLVTLKGTGGANPFIIGRGGSVTGIVNLDGGTLSTGRSLRGNNLGGGGTATVNFNGGTLKAIDNNNAAWVNPTLGSTAGSGKIFVKSGGAKFDTNGFSMGIPDPLQHDATLGATPDGGLTLADTAVTPGTLTLSGNNTYTGNTTISNGTLKLTTATTNNIASSPLIHLSTAGSTLDVTSVTGAGGFALDSVSGQTLKGIGTVLGTTTVGNNTTIAPGNSVGMLTTASETWNNGATFHFEINDADGGAGNGWDLLTISGAGAGLTLSSGTITVDLDTLMGSVAGEMADFDKLQSYDWLFVDAVNAITTFNNVSFVVDDTDFMNDISGNIQNGMFSVVLGDTVAGGDNTQLYLHYQAAQAAVVPEPSTLTMALVCALALTLFAWRRRP
jgi:autotransporter-associated beta strand protein